MNHVVIWGSAPSCHLKILATRQNNMLRVMSGVRWVDGIPDISTQEMYKSSGIMNINSLEHQPFEKLGEVPCETSVKKCVTVDASHIIFRR